MQAVTAASPKASPIVPEPFPLLLLPEEIVMHIFIYLKTLDLNRTSRACKVVRILIEGHDLWKKIAFRAYPEQARFFEHFFTVTSRPPKVTPPNWHRYAVIQAVMAAQLLNPNRDFTPSFTRRKMISGYPTLPNHPILSPTTTSSVYSTNGCCSVRTTKAGKFEFYNLETCVLIRKNGEPIWRSAIGEQYIFPGGLDLYHNLTGRWEWNHFFTRPRQQMPFESLSPFFFTRHPSEEIPAIKAISLYNLNDLSERVITLEHNKGKKVCHIDCNKDGDLFFIAVITPDRRHQNVLVHRSRKKPEYYDKLNVLAFDPLRSRAVVQSLDEKEKGHPIQYVYFEKAAGAKKLCFKELAIAPAEQYKAQIKDNHMVIWSRSRNEMPEVSLFPLDLSNKYELKYYLAQYVELKNLFIRYFTLYDDLFVLLTSSPDGKRGPLVTFTLNSLDTPPTIFPIKATDIIGREADVLICQAENELWAVNFKDKTAQKLIESGQPSIYSPKIFILGKHSAITV